MAYRVTACTMMGHLLDMSHRPETLDSARRWADELAGLPCIRHVLIAETSEHVIHWQPGAGSKQEEQAEQDDCPHPPVARHAL